MAVGGEDPSADLGMQSQDVQTENNNSIFCGEVVDVRDPLKLGRVRLQVYPINGDYPQTDVSTLYWAECPTGCQGAFGPPQLGDHMLCAFEAGSMFAPLALGHILAHPKGDGNLPWSKRNKSDVRPEGQWNHDMYPESIIPGASKNGNTISINDLFMVTDPDAHKGYLASQICLQDTGGKFFRIKTFHAATEVQHWSPIMSFPIGPGGLIRSYSGDNDAIRTGYETNSDLEQISGVVEFGDVSLKRQMISGNKEDNFSQDQVFQMDDQDAVAYDQSAVAGKAFRARQESAAMSMMGSSMFLQSQMGIMTSAISSPPRRWDN